MRKATVSFVTSVLQSVHVEELGSHWADFHEIWYFWFFRKNLLRKFSCHENLTTMTGTLRDGQHTFSIIFRSILLRMKNISDKIVEKLKAHILCSVIFFFENYTVYEITWKNVVEPGRPQMMIRRMRIACWMPKATNAYTGCVILIASLQQQWLHERASMLRFTNISCLVLWCW